MKLSGLLLSAGSAEDMLLLMTVIVGALLFVFALISGINYIKHNWKKLPNVLTLIKTRLTQQHQNDSADSNAEKKQHDFSPIC